MPGSLQIATIRGIPIRVHFTMLVVVAVLVAQFGLLGIPAGILLFGSVLAHELGHSVVAQRFGVPIAGIELHLLGGAAFMRGLPRLPRHELWIALAGPMVSLALGVGAATLAIAVGRPVWFYARDGMDLLSFFAAVNLGMAIFNLIPALPMDGGRVLRAWLAERSDVLTATRKAARLSRIISGTFVLFGIYIGGWTLALLGVVLFGMAGHELRVAEMQAFQESERMRAWVELVRGGPRRPPGGDGGGPIIDV